MRAKELRNMAGEELGNTLKDLQKRLFELRFQAATDRLETPDAINKARRDIARVMTIQKEKERAATKS